MGRMGNKHTESTDNTEKVPVYDSNYWLRTITIDENDERIRCSVYNNVNKAVMELLELGQLPIGI